MERIDRGKKPLEEKDSPLAARMRPRTLDEFVGQGHIVGPGRLLRRAIQADQISSVIFYGPPGTGKTTLASVITNTTQGHYEVLNAVLAGVADVRRVTRDAQERRAGQGQRTILFVDEVHRWNKAQQDALLPWVENGTVVFIGATTENPYFSVNRPLLSRSRIFQFKPLTREDLRGVAARALSDSERGYGRLKVHILEEALDHLVDVANGDARGVLNALELAVETTPADEYGVILVDMAVAEESIQRRAVLYDKDGDYHYDTISAFIKAVRGSDPDASLYWLARMVYAGEDPRFLFRRMLILAGEDVGLADPNAIRVVHACAEAFERVGMPEGAFHLAEAALYLATAPKSNSTLAFFDALSTVQKERDAGVPGPLKDASRDKEGFGHGQGYLYPHAYRDHWVAQQYLPDSLQGRVFYQPSDQGFERGIREEVARRREAQLAALVDSGGPSEILTFAPGTRTHDRWLQRAVSNAGERLGRIRDRVLDAARIERHHVVLDLNAANGLLTWEAVRRAPEGGTWALVPDEHTGSVLAQAATAIPELLRPVILAGALEDLPALLARKGHVDQGFDALVGRNAVGHIVDKASVFRLLGGLLHDRGILSLAETVLSRTNRLYDLVEISSLDEGLRTRLKEAEECIYTAPENAALNWHSEDLLRAFGAAGLERISAIEEDLVSEMLVTEATLDRWFDLSPERARPSYARSLLTCMSAEETERIRILFRSQLLGKTIPWKTRIVFLSGRRARG